MPPSLLIRSLIFPAALTLLSCSAVDSRVAERWTALRKAEPIFDGGRALSVPPILPVVFVPGSKGSVLREGSCEGKIVWGDTRVVWRSALDDLIIPLPGVALESRFKKKVLPCDVLASLRVRLFLPFLTTVEYPVYRDFREVLEKAGGFSVEERSIFYFPYDWRLDNRMAAAELAEALPSFRKQYYEGYLKHDYCKKWQEKAGEAVSLSRCLKVIYDNWPELFARGRVDHEYGYDIKFNMIAHSMGGLVAQYLLRGLGYGDEVQDLVLIAVPTQGAMFALQILTEGELVLGGALIHYYDKKDTRPVGFSFSSVFQGLPRYPGAIKNDDYVLQHRLGLTTEIYDEASAEKAWQRLLGLSGPGDADSSWRLICRVSDAGPEFSPECRRRFFGHLRHELRSAFFFQQTIVEGFCGLVAKTPEYVRERRQYERTVLQEVALLFQHLRGRALTVSHRRCPDENGSGTVHEKRPTRIHQFFGHCEHTPTFAMADPESGRLHFCPDEPLDKSACMDFGDDRIPRVSMDVLRTMLRKDQEAITICPPGSPSAAGCVKPLELSLEEYVRLYGRVSDFVVCGDHVNIVKDAIVQDNLLKILFGRRVEPALAR